MQSSWFCAAAFGVLALACGDGEGEGTITVTAYGEPFIEEGIPADAMDDGWAITFQRFAVSLRDVQVAGVPVGIPALIDVSEPSAGAGHEYGSTPMREGNYDNGSFVIDRIVVEGTAILDAATKTFAWEFLAPTSYDACQTTTTVPDGGVGTFQVTVHADHLFYDSLVSEEPLVLFQAMADADTDTDGQITQAELTATGIGSYDPGSEGGVENLWDWLVAATRTIGHVDGEGHCDAAAL
jgi:hypothetical protein